MRPFLHPVLVNGRTGDPAVYVETLFEKRALLLDLGSLESLPSRKILRVEHVFVSHTHVDHFIGFDRLLRTLVGREKTVHLYGPEGFIANVRHKLHAYRWNLGERYPCDLIFVVSEIHSPERMRAARFRLRTAFAEEMLSDRPITAGAIRTGDDFRASMAILDHRIPCLGFAIEEPAHVNVWKSRLEARGLAVGPWLRELKRAIVKGESDSYEIGIGTGRTPAAEQNLRLGELRDLVTVTPGQKIAYVTDIADTPGNAAAVVELIRGVDILFIETPFRQEDAALAAARAHLTTAAAGRLARKAGVRRIEPFHFSPRYEGGEAELAAETTRAFEGRDQIEINLPISTT
jgi:ribonuclease Z